VRRLSSSGTRACTTASGGVPLAAACALPDCVFLHVMFSLAISREVELGWIYQTYSALRPG